MLEDSINTHSVLDSLEYERRKLIEDIEIVQACCKKYNMGILINNDYYATFPDENSIAFDQQEVIEAIIRMVDYCSSMRKVIIIEKSFLYAIRSNFNN